MSEATPPDPGWLKGRSRSLASTAINELRKELGDDAVLAAVRELDAIDKATGLDRMAYWEPLTFDPEAPPWYAMESIWV